MILLGVPASNHLELVVELPKRDGSSVLQPSFEIVYIKITNKSPKMIKRINISFG